MIKKIKNAFYTASATMLALPVIVSAQGYSQPVNPGGMPDSDANTIITNVLNWFLGILAVLSILMIVIAGIMYITSGGDEGRVDKAKSWLTYSIIGLVVALLGFVIVKAIGAALGV